MEDGNVFIRNIGKYARVWYKDDQDFSREKDGIIADADLEFVVLLKNMDSKGIKINSITRFEIKEVNK